MSDANLAPTDPFALRNARKLHRKNLKMRVRVLEQLRIEESLTKARNEKRREEAAKRQEEREKAAAAQKEEVTKLSIRVPEVEETTCCYCLFAWLDKLNSHAKRDHRVQSPQ